MDNLLPVTIGGLLALAAGLVFRAAEARQQRRHWFRDQLREAAERFLTDAQRFLDVVWEKMIGELPDGSVAIRRPSGDLEMDVSRLQLVAPKIVSDMAVDVFKKLKAAFDAAQKAGSPFEQEDWAKANAAAETATKQMTAFADLVRRHLK
jgi:hypothetical protein